MIRVAIIEDQREIREGLASLIGATGEFRSVGAWASVEDAIRAIAVARPDVVLVGLQLNGISGIEGIRILKEKYSNLLLLVLTCTTTNGFSNRFAPALAVIC